jgi:hypothetical protein
MSDKVFDKVRKYDNHPSGLDATPHPHRDSKNDIMSSSYGGWEKTLTQSLAESSDPETPETRPT